MAQTVVGVFNNRDDATDAIHEMEEKGFNAKDFSIIMKDKAEGQHVAEETGSNVASGAAEGAVSGAVIGGLAGLVASFLIPGLGAFFIGGPIAVALGLTGAAATTASGVATGAIAGGIIGALGQLGMDDRQAHYYEVSINNGGIFVAVPVTDAQTAEVKEIFASHHADQVRSVSNTAQEKEEISHQHYTQPAYVYTGAKGGESQKKVSHKKETGHKGGKATSSHKKQVKKIKEIEYD